MTTTQLTLDTNDPTPIRDRKRCALEDCEHFIIDERSYCFTHDNLERKANR